MSSPGYPFPTTHLARQRAQDSATPKTERPAHDASPKLQVRLDIGVHQSWKRKRLLQGDAVSQMNHHHGAQTGLKASALRSSHSPARPQANAVQLHDARGSAQREPSAHPSPPQNTGKPQVQHQVHIQQHSQHSQRPKVPQLQINTHTRGSSSTTSHHNTPQLAAQAGSAPTPGQGSNTGPVVSPPGQHFHPEVVRGAAAALLPAQSLFENAWQVTVHRVQTEFNRMHTAMTSRVDAEKAAHARTHEACTRLRGELEDVRFELGLVNKERERLSGDLVKALEDNRVLRTHVANAKKEQKELGERCKRLGVEMEIWKESAAIARAVKARFGESANGQDDIRLIDADGEKIMVPPELMEKIQQQIDSELQARIGKLLADEKHDSGLKIQTDTGPADIERRDKPIFHTSMPTVATHPSPHSTPSSSNASSPSNEHISHSETSTAVGTPASGSPNLKLEARKCGADQDGCRVVSVEPWSGTISPEVSVVNVETRSQLEGCPASKLAEDGGCGGDVGKQENVRPSKRRRTGCGEEEQASESCGGRRPEMNVERLKLQTTAQSSESELSDREHRAKSLKSDVDDSVDDMQLESDSDFVKNSPIASESRSQTPWTRRTTPAPVRSKIGINHIDLLYETQPQRMVCRMCLTRQKNGGKNAVMSFPLDASWAALIGHCESEHPAARKVLERMSSAQVVEMRQRILRGEVVRW